MLIYLKENKLKIKRMVKRDLCITLLLAVGFICFITGLVVGHYQQYQHEKFLQEMVGGGVPMSEIEELIEQNHQLTEKMKDIFTRLGLEEEI